MSLKSLRRRTVFFTAWALRAVFDKRQFDGNTITASYVSEQDFQRAHMGEWVSENPAAASAAAAAAVVSPNGAAPPFGALPGLPGPPGAACRMPSCKVICGNVRSAFLQSRFKCCVMTDAHQTACAEAQPGRLGLLQHVTCSMTW